MSTLIEPKLLVAALAVALLTACGGGDGGVVSQTSTGFLVDGGVAQKGPLLKGSHVWIDELNPLTYAPAGFSYDLLTKDNQGRFDASAIKFTTQHIQTFAEGYYFNEISGYMANDSVLLQAQGDLVIDRLVNVNLLTTLAGPRLVALVTDKTKPATYGKFAAARTQAQKEVLAAFRIYNSTDLMPGGVDATLKLVPANFSELDLSGTQSANQILAAISALAVKTGGNGVGISQFIANFQLDLTDDGLINGTGGASSVRGQIDTASATAGMMTTVATNLNTFYGANTITAAQLTPWVDSSGGADQVIDKYKNSGTGVLGKKTLSAAYAAGADDLGQCFWVSTGTLYRNGVAVVGSAKAVATNIFKIGLTGSVGGPLSGFIQRSAPLSTGLCPTTVPKTGLTRVAKYTAQFPITLGGTVSGLGTGGQVILKNNGGDALTVSANGKFTFATLFAANSFVYKMGVPRTAAQDLTVIYTPVGGTFSATGCMVVPVIAGTGAATVSVKRASTTECAYQVDVTTALVFGDTINWTPPVGYMATSGLASSIALNLWDVSETARVDNSQAVTPRMVSAYAVTVGTQPMAQICTVANAIGTDLTADVSNIAVTCSAAAGIVGGTVTGLGIGSQVTLKNNGGDALTVSANGKFYFATPLAATSVVYKMGVTRTAAQDFTIIMTPSAGATFTAAYCAATLPVGGGAGALTAYVKRMSATECAYEIDVTTATDTTTTLTFAAPVIVAHPWATSGNSVSVWLNLWDLGETARIDNSAAVTARMFATYAVTVGTQPTGQICTVANAMGTIDLATIFSNIAVTCTAAN